MNAPEIEQRLGAWSVPADPTASSECRDRLLEFLRYPPDRPGTDDVVLVVSELASNAAEHGTGPSFQLAAEDLGNEVRLRVTNEADHPPPAAPWPMPPPTSLRGRGLAVVEQVSRSVSFAFDGSTVEFVAMVELGTGRP